MDSVGGQYYAGSSAIDPDLLRVMFGPGAAVGGLIVHQMYLAPPLVLPSAAASGEEWLAMPDKVIGCHLPAPRLRNIAGPRHPCRHPCAARVPLPLRIIRSSLAGRGSVAEGRFALWHGASTAKSSEVPSDFGPAGLTAVWVELAVAAVTP